MKLCYVVTLTCLNIFLTSLASADIVIRDYPPNTKINGMVVPSEAVFSPALKQGESAVVVINGKTAMRLNVLEGQVTKLSTRFKLSTSSDITYERQASGVSQESAKKYVNVKDGVEPSGPASNLVKNTGNFKEKITGGSYKCIALTKNGFGNTFVLQDDGFKIELTGSNIVSNHLYIGIEGNFSGGAVSTLVKD